ncbi:MAG: SWIB/MDM2 domain-containing protein [Chthoniobacterales bacterium]|nr:SWIB/MDM2 domain-containing protein [Chthoniobacterales bacterium]
MSKEKSGRKVNPALMKPVQPDEVLAAIVGAEAQPRSQITKKIWDYVKKHGLQDGRDKRRINADEKLKALFGGREFVSMFEVAKFISQHIQ